MIMRALSKLPVSRGTFLLFGAGSLAATLLSLLSPWPMAIMVDNVLSGKPHGFRLPAEPLLAIACLAALSLGLRLAEELIGARLSLLRSSVGVRTLLAVRGEMFRKLQRIDLQYHHLSPKGTEMYRLSSDATGFRSVFDVLLSIATSVVTVVVMVAILITSNIWLALALMAAVPAVALLNVVYGRRLERRSTLARESDSEASAELERSLDRLPLTRVCRREEFEEDTFDRHASLSLDAWFQTDREMVWYRLWVGSVFAAVGSMVMGLGGALVYAGSVTLGELLVFTSYLAGLYGPVCTLTGAHGEMQKALTGVRRVFDLLDLEPEIRERPGALTLPVERRTLRFEDLSFGYSGTRPVLKDLHLEVRPGEAVALVGPSGEGKTTMMNLTARLYDPTQGAVTLDGHDLRDLSLETVRAHLAILSQHPILLRGTIAQNIAYSKPEATLEEIKQAAVAAGADAFIRRLPEGYHTELGETGAGLSGGQRQRLALARALLTRAPFLLLDEPTSALDPVSEARLLDTIEGLKGRHTIIMVTHRASSLRVADRVVVLSEGRIVEEGPPSEVQLIAC